MLRVSDDTAIVGLADLLAGVNPVRRPGEFIFITVDDVSSLPVSTQATVWEDGRLSCVIEHHGATSTGDRADPVMAWITLQVHSSLVAVGLTAAVSTALTERNIACNVIAGHRHDHILVPIERADEAMAAITALAQR
jgi:hypothetical protein